MQPEIIKSEQPQENILRSLLFKYLGHWPVFLVLLALCGVSAWFYLQTKVPVYEVNATIIIKDEQKGLDDSKMVAALNLFKSNEIVENEIEVIKSQTLAAEVVRNLYLYAPITDEGAFSNYAAYTISPIQIVAKYPDSIKAVDKVHFTLQKDNDKVLINGKMYSLGQWVNTPYGTLKFVSNPNYLPANNTDALFFSLIPVEYVADDLVAGLDVSSSSKLSTVVNISIQDEVPQRGKAVLNELINAYNRAAIEDKNKLAANTLSFVEDRLHYVVHELDSVETKIQNFKTNNKVIDLSTQGKLFLENVGQNDQKIGDISMQLAVLDQVKNYVSGKGDKGGIVPSTLGITDPVLSNLLEKLYNAELEYEKIKKIAPENNPMLVSITDQIEKIKPNILENIENQRKGLVAGKSDLVSTNSKYTSMLGTIPEKERELLEISRQQAIKNNIYTFLLQKREEAAISYASAVANNRLVDSAKVSRYPVGPNKPIIYIAAIIIAFGAGIGYVVVKGFFYANVESAAEVEKHTHIPVLAELIHNNSKNSVVVTEDNRSFIAEQFRQLRTMLGYLGIGSRKKKIMITSAIPEEGKSFVAVNLAMTLALNNKKVALVDLDLRRPSLASLLGVVSSEGASQYLNGELEIEAIIKATDKNKNLFLISSGAIPPNPSELLGNGKIMDLFTYLEEVFDYIIIDTSPTTLVTDAYILSPLCDATLYVVRQGVTPKALVQKIDKYSRINNLKNSAIILNDMKRNSLGRYEYGYSYNSYIDNRKGKLKKKSFI